MLPLFLYRCFISHAVQTSSWLLVGDANSRRIVLLLNALVYILQFKSARNTHVVVVVVAAVVVAVVVVGGGVVVEV